jgi:hypothetical protein
MEPPVPDVEEVLDVVVVVVVVAPPPAPPVPEVSLPEDLHAAQRRRTSAEARPRKVDMVWISEERG